jgi:galactose-1-phosphate uridylyltransferase
VTSIQQKVGILNAIVQDPLRIELEAALREPERVLYSDAACVAFVPRGAKSPFEIWILARQTAAEGAVDAFDQAIRNVETRVDLAWPDAKRRFSMKRHSDARAWIQFQEQTVSATPTDAQQDLESLRAVELPAELIGDEPN